MTKTPNNPNQEMPDGSEFREAYQRLFTPEHNGRNFARDMIDKIPLGVVLPQEVMMNGANLCMVDAIRSGIFDNNDAAMTQFRDGFMGEWLPWMAAQLTDMDDK